ncbi:MAG TPA: RDD family protein [Longimicrobium sp.]|jgi:uncharacterized RDD family membrane protein YckC|uniref:RDD family protein n=1 Tax=Longimicrobium sp. TaxID=2029185 RepID=UPI002ED900ED
MSDTERYVHQVLRHVPAAFPERRARIGADLRAYLADSVAAGESEEGAVRRMGPPEQAAESFLLDAPLPLAPPWDRVGAYVLDNVLVAAPVIGAMALAALLNPDLLVSHPQTPRLRVVVGVLVAGTIAFSVLYFPLFEARTGQTPGKRLFGIAVVKTSGTAVHFGRALLRRLPSLFNFALLDALFAAFTAMRQRAFDIVAGTLVVSVPRPPRRLRAWVATGVLAAVTAGAMVALLSLVPRAAAPAPIREELSDFSAGPSFP